MILLGVVAVGVLFWAARTGQFDDLEGDAHRILMDDDDHPDRNSGKKNVENAEQQKETRESD